MSQSLFVPRPPRLDEIVFEPGEPMESERHRRQMTVLLESLEDAWRDRTDFYAGGDMPVYFSEAQTRKNDFRAPDVFVVLDTARHERKGWVVWLEDGRTPNVVIELLSDTTEHIDRGEKKRIYAQALKVGEYFLFDPFSGVLEGYELDAVSGVYRRKTADGHGRLSCVQMGLLLGKQRSTLYGIDAEWLRWMTLEGEPLELPSERANAETERANAETERANAETERAERLAAELAALRAERQR